MISPLLTILNGEISYFIRKSNLTKTEVDIQLTASSMRWNNFDVEFEYRNNDEEEWKSDAILSFTTGNSIVGNRIYGLKASKTGYTNLLRWNFEKNALTYGVSIQLRIKILPRIRNFGYSVINSAITETWGENGADLIAFSRSKKCVGINRTGQYICLTSSSVQIFNSMDYSDMVPTYSYSSLNNPSHVIQIDNGNYIVADYGNNRVIEIDETLSTLINSYSISTPVFVDYDNINSLTLITSSGLNSIREVSLDLSYISWSSSSSILNPQSATYSFDNKNEVVISDLGNNRVVIENKTTSYSEIKTGYKVSHDSLNEISFYHPYRSYKFNDDSVVVIEKDGKIVDFNYVSQLLNSSSSSGT